MSGISNPLVKQLTLILRYCSTFLTEKVPLIRLYYHEYGELCWTDLILAIVSSGRRSWNLENIPLLCSTSRMPN